MPKYRSGITSTTVIFVHDIPQFCHTSGVTANQETRQTLMGSQVLLLQCYKTAAVLVTCKHRDSVPEVLQCGSRSLDFLLTLKSIFFTAVAMISASTYVRVVFEI